MKIEDKFIQITFAFGVLVWLGIIGLIIYVLLSVISMIFEFLCLHLNIFGIIALSVVTVLFTVLFISSEQGDEIDCDEVDCYEIDREEFYERFKGDLNE